MAVLKRIICGTLIAAVTLCTCGCSSGSDNETNSSSSASSAATSSQTDTMPAPAGTESSATTSEAGSSDDNNGTYDVPENGVVTDEGSDEANEPDGDGLIEDKDKTDEAAFASSYMKLGANGLSLTKIGWGLGKERDEDNRPIDAVNAEEKYESLGGRFLTSGKNICLTFDEGYENGYTAEILDILKEKGVKAVFFVTYDYCRTSPELIKRMIDEGHTVGNHTYSHPSLPDCSDKEITDEITMLHNYVKEQFGYEMSLFRFPKGEFSESALSIINDLGYTSLFWSFAYNDWDTKNQPDKSEALKKIKESTHSGIYLLHAVSSTNAAILGEVLDHWKAEGYTVGSAI